ncbi:MAG: radical SAM protein [Desulfatitalea sp. BRH_c12]|nr:MAG: radical SAM protein [Desulfatitalea sp. BRH_c12]
MTTPPHILLVNPWIHDFAAYDVWAHPYGLLSIAALLRDHGVKVTYVDCLDRFHPNMASADPHARHGRGPYLKTRLANPKGLENIARTYSRYGIRPEWLRAELAAVSPTPDLILVTSIMTYWYPGVFETIAALKDFFQGVPVILGGIYARLWEAHARAHSGADHVASDDGRSLPDLMARYTGFDLKLRYDWADLDAWPYPAFDLQRRIAAVPLLTARGCPFDCAYCASGFLEQSVRRRSPIQVVDEIQYWHRAYGVQDFAFYDDALLVDAHNHAIPMLEAIVRSGLKVRFHTPNALHIRSITAQTARLMFLAGFHTIRLGLETAAFEAGSRLDHKVTAAEFKAAVAHLKSAGFRGQQIGAYLLVGLPGQSVAAVESSIQTVKEAGIMPVPAHYTPIPHTRLWDAAKTASRYDLAADPLFSNNAIFPCQQGFSWETLSHLKQMTSSDSAA